MAVITLGLWMIDFLLNTLKGDLYMSVFTLLSSTEFGCGQWDYASAAMKFPHVPDFTVIDIDNIIKDIYIYVLYL